MVYRQRLKENRVLSVAEIGSRDSVYIDNSGIVTRSRIVLLENDYLTYQSNRIPVQAMAADSAYFELFPYRVLQGFSVLGRSGVSFVNGRVLLKNFSAKKILLARFSLIRMERRLG